MVFASLIIFYLQSCHVVGFSADVSFCRLISKISLYIQNKFSVVSAVRGTLLFTSLQGMFSLFWGWGVNILLSKFQRALFYINKLCLKHLLLICLQKLQYQWNQWQSYHGFHKGEPTIGKFTLGIASEDVSVMRGRGYMLLKQLNS